MTKEQWFKLIKEEFSEIDKEWQWTYSLLTIIIFNEQEIREITITDHYQLEHKDIMSNEKILAIVRKLNNAIRKPEPKKKPNWPDVFVEKGIEYENKKHLLVFWFNKKNPHGLWIKNCYPD